ncbi:MAG: hypothetical protein ACUVXA_08385 [Candidatus Jordarchaeum sp.]|uniref:hypothetical protein n=1 Tax=Candidatus Jordarchaeum sp. TaxID=2823881 RepID=UPI00404B4794
MKIPERAKQEGILEYAERLSELYSRIYDAKIRKLKGQFFTPKEVSRFMEAYLKYLMARFVFWILVRVLLFLLLPFVSDY